MKKLRKVSDLFSLIIGVILAIILWITVMAIFVSAIVGLIGMIVH